MRIAVIEAWFNYEIKVQRRPAVPSRNAFNEPDYGDESTWPVIPDSLGDLTHAVRIEFDMEEMIFTPTGERVAERMTRMFVSPDDDIRPEDRISIVVSDVSPHLNQYFIVMAIWPENDSVGNVSHYVADIQVH